MGRDGWMGVESAWVVVGHWWMGGWAWEVWAMWCVAGWGKWVVGWWGEVCWVGWGWNVGVLALHVANSYS